MTAIATLAATLEAPSFDSLAATSRTAKLTRDEVSRYRSEGYVLIHDFFAVDEIAWLGHETDILARRFAAGHGARADAAWADESPSGTLYGLHLRDESLRRLSAHPRLLGIAQYLLGGEIGVHQSRLLHRQMTVDDEAIVRRDFATWSKIDGMKRPQALTAVVFFGGGAMLQVVPRSHRAASADASGSDRTIVPAQLGSVLLYDANLAYVLGGSGGLQPSFLVSYNLLSNETPGHRDEIFAAREPVAVVPEIEDCLWPSALCTAG